MTDMLAATPLHALGMNVRNRLPEDAEEEAAGGVVTAAGGLTSCSLTFA
jgi:hypothetical protein